MRYIKSFLIFCIFVLCSFTVMGAYDIKENYMVNDDTQMYIHSTQWSAQTFNTSVGYDLKVVGIKLYQATNYMVNVSLYPTNATSAPDCSGSPLVSQSVNGSTLGASPGAFVNFTFDSAYTLSADTDYAIVAYVDCVGMTGTDWRMDGSSAAYAGGSRFTSTDSGATWSEDVGDDMMFATYEDSGSDSCTYSSGDWVVTASDGCDWTSNIDLLGNAWTINGAGTVTITDINVTNVDSLTINGATFTMNGGSVTVE